MDHEMNGKRVHMYSNKQNREHHTHQQTLCRKESHTCEAILIFIFIYFILFYYDPILFFGRCFGFWFLVCYAATQLATQLQQRCIQVGAVIRKPGNA